jgi:hypothetical protein
MIHKVNDFFVSSDFILTVFEFFTSLTIPFNRWELCKSTTNLMFTIYKKQLTEKATPLHGEK